jgi:hypothetical protein
MKPISEAVLLTRLSRWSAWAAMLIVVLYIVTGYGMTKRIVDPDWAKRLHERWLPIPLFLTLLLHGGVCARGAARRWHVFRNAAAGDLYVLTVGIVLFGLFMWLYLV